MEKPIAGFLQVLAALMFISAGALADEAGFLLLAPAAVAQISGLLLWAKGQRAAQLPPPVRPADDDDRRIAQMQEVLGALQEDVAKLREDREFFQRLYSPGHTSQER